MSKVLHIDHAGWPVEDLLRAEAFYRNLLGGELEAHVNLNVRAQLNGRAVISFLRIGGHHGMGLFLQKQYLGEPADPERHGPRVAWELSREDFERTLAQLREQGVPLVGPTPHSDDEPIAASLYLNDSEGNPLELCYRR
jgi:catechol-2,3-dioxygenase